MYTEPIVDNETWTCLWPTKTGKRGKSTQSLAETMGTTREGAANRMLKESDIMNRHFWSHQTCK